MAQPVGDFVHSSVGKATVPFDIDHGGIVGKPQSRLFKYPTHIYEHINNSILLVIENMFNQIRSEMIRLLKSQIASTKFQINSKFKISMTKTKCCDSQ
jgi:hypothetical protein